MIRTTMKTTMGAALQALLAALVTLAPAPASAGLLDGLFGSESSKAEARRRTWTIHEYTTVRLVPRESGSAVNQHPLQADRETLRQLLGQIRFDDRDGTQSLFAMDELVDLVEPLSQALASAGPDDDLLLLSTSRRGAGIVSQPLGVTARFFVRDGALQMIVNDARYEFLNESRGSNRPPTFTFGSRAKAGSAVLRSPYGTGPRPDWVVLPTQAQAVAAPAAQNPAVAPATARPSTAAVPAPAAAVVPMPAARDPGFGAEIEQRLQTIRRLRDKGLITEEEYQQKRKEILALL